VTTPAADDAEHVPVPIRVVLPADPLLGTEQQEVIARLWKRRQTEAGWVYLVGLPSYRGRESAIDLVRFPLPRIRVADRHANSTHPRMVSRVHRSIEAGPVAARRLSQGVGICVVTT
jgi:hypothetical protein